MSGSEHVLRSAQAGETVVAAHENTRDSLVYPLCRSRANVDAGCPRAPRGSRRSDSSFGACNVGTGAPMVGWVRQSPNGQKSRVGLAPWHSPRGIRGRPRAPAVPTPVSLTGTRILSRVDSAALLVRPGWFGPR